MDYALYRGTQRWHAALSPCGTCQGLTATPKPLQGRSVAFTNPLPRCPSPADRYTFLAENRSPWVASHVAALKNFKYKISIFISISFVFFDFYCNRWDDSLDEGRAVWSFFVCYVASLETFEINQKTKNDKKRRKNIRLLHSEKLKVVLVTWVFAECRQQQRRRLMKQRHRKWALRKYRNKRTLKIRW